LLDPSPITMKVSEFKKQLENNAQLGFNLPNGQKVPAHFHITEMGYINKKYTDCGNTFREENYFSFQLWYANDTDHRLTADKVIKIIAGIEKNIGENDYEIQVEYQGEDTIGKFKLATATTGFKLIPTQTTCLAMDSCGSPKDKIKIGTLKEAASSCAPNSGCC
jgi:hypothetical protein